MKYTFVISSRFLIKDLVIFLGQSEDNQMENESPNGENKKESLVQQFEKTLFNDAVDTKEFGIKEAPAGMYFKIIRKVIYFSDRNSYRILQEKQFRNLKRSVNNYLHKKIPSN